MSVTLYRRKPIAGTFQSSLTQHSITASAKLLNVSQLVLAGVFLVRLDRVVLEQSHNFKDEQGRADVVWTNQDTVTYIHNLALFTALLHNLDLHLEPFEIKVYLKK